MRKRNCRVQVRLDNKEYQHFMKLVRKSGVSQEVYLRHLINGVVPRDDPPADYHSFMKQLYHIGHNLNQIAHKAHAMNVMDVGRFDETRLLVQNLATEIADAVIEPRKMN